jgi:hypothetical protein
MEGYHTGEGQTTPPARPSGTDTLTEHCRETLLMQSARI